MFHGLQRLGRKGRAFADGTCQNGGHPYIPLGFPQKAIPSIKPCKETRANGSRDPNPGGHERLRAAPQQAAAREGWIREQGPPSHAAPLVESCDLSLPNGGCALAIPWQSLFPLVFVAWCGRSNLKGCSRMYCELVEGIHTLRLALKQEATLYGLASDLFFW